MDLTPGIVKDLETLLRSGRTLQEIADNLSGIKSLLAMQAQNEVCAMAGETPLYGIASFDGYIH